ncbi:hypothetical protein PXJ20_32070 [Paraburkholderia sp. A1RI_3L]|uniref:hypothetical protein n=1 Tax=Paraburkholderia TaxID=1822464 RepID=UPI003B7AC4BA
MSFLDTLENMAKGAAAGVAVLVALPVFGAVGTVTAAGIAVGSSVGAAAALIDDLKKDD